MKEEDKLDWWEDPKNKEFFPLPISVIQDGKWWVATVNDDTEKLIGAHVGAAAQGETKDEAISMMMTLIRAQLEYSEDCVRKYQRWVPIRVGDWSRTGGTWVVIFGIRAYFRYGKGMRGGFYIPLTKLNISIRNEWKTYRNWKLNNKNEGCN